MIYAFVTPETRPEHAGYGRPPQKDFAVRRSSDGQVIHDRMDQTIADEFCAALNAAFDEGYETGKANAERPSRKKTTVEKLFPEGRR